MKYKQLGVVDPVSFSSVGLGVPVLSDEREECWWWSCPGEWLSWPPFPGGLLCENPETGCVCVV